MGTVERGFFAPVSAAAIYVLWVALTWTLEGRTHLLLRDDPIGRAAYAIVANVAFGIALGMLAARTLGLRTHGRRPTERTYAAAIATFILVALVAVRMGDAFLLTNAAMNILPTALAEIVVCWVLVGGVAQKLTGSRWAAIAAADVFFAAYHVAHSPPFDTLPMILFLLVPGFAIGIFVFVVRSLTLAVVAQTAFAIVGLAQNVDMSPFVDVRASAWLIAGGSLLAFRLAQGGRTRRV